ncbi:MAG: tetratricopeptide repeat protein [Acidobacteria bacterium]|nr:MAG: tetratricopeptide repeat protein [Acidobacteriota bacterium]
MTGKRLVEATICVLLVTGAGPLWAAAQGRVFGTVIDQNDEPLTGVTVTILNLDTNDETIRETNKKGKFTAVLLDATKRYAIRLEKEGYQSVEEALEPVVGDILRATWRLVPGAARPAAAAPGAPSSPDVTSRRAAQLYEDGAEAFEAGDLDLALEKFQQFASENPEIPEVHRALAMTYFRKEDYAEAAAAAEHLLELNPGDGDAARILVEAYREMGDEESAAKALVRLEELEPDADTARLVFNSGVTLFQSGDPEGAVVRFERAVEMDPELAPAYSVLASLYLNLGDYEKSIANAERHLELVTEDPRTYGILYLAHRALGDKAKADEAFEAMKAANPGFLGEGFLDFGILDFNAGNVAEAQEIFERVLEALPDQPKAHYYLALCLLSGGDTATAKEHLQRFVELAPDDPDAATARDMLATM